MSINYSKSLGLVAVLYFTASFQAQKVKKDSVKEKALDEVVVIGYGTQKKSSVTGAISSIKSKDIENVPVGNVAQVMQGRTAGVNIMQNAGQPGSTSTIRVRGITTIGTSGSGSNDPLYVIDGVVQRDPNILNTIDQNDIESIEVLKDAASASIYGVAAATGVVLVTTKKGRSGKISVSYNGSYGISSVYRKLNLLNATQYATILNERSVNSGNGMIFSDTNSFGTGTNWQNQIFNTAARQSHEFSFSGGSDKSTFYSSFGYLDQEGIVLKDISNFKRITARLNSTYKIADFLTIGENFSYTHSKSVGLGNTNSEFGGPLSSAINLDPITPVVETNPAIIASNYSSPNAVYVRDLNGNPYGISQYVGQEMTNPVAYSKVRNNSSWADDFVGNAFLELKPVKDLTFKSVIGGKLSFTGTDSYTPKFYLSPTVGSIQTVLSRSDAKRLDWSFENFLTYKKSLKGHNFTAMVGTGYYKVNHYQETGVTYSNIRDNSFNFGDPSVNLSSAYSYDSYKDGSPIEFINTAIFGRLIYDYKEKYLFTGVIRRDGSSKFGPDKRYGNFPSVSAGWVVSKEGFWGSNNPVDLFKIRGGWGQTGNDRNLSPYQWTSTIEGGRNYTVGGVIIAGLSPSTLANPKLHWETTTQTNIGFDSRFLKNFNLTVDLYRKQTDDILQQIDIPGYVGVPKKPWDNVMSMRNEGVEVELGYKKKFENFGISVNTNFSYLKNTVTSIGNLDFIDGPGFQSMGAITRTTVGQALNSFYGYQSLGVFQNQAQIDAYKNAGGTLIQPGAKPGDMIWSDLNGDGKINNDDRTYLGNSIPKYNYGVTVNLDYKNFDLMVFAQGAAGYKIFQGYRRLDIINANYTTDILNRWTGEGTSNDYPRLTINDTNGNYSRPSGLYLKDGDYLRIKLVQLGYSLPKDVASSFGASKVRLYVTAENLVTFTKYNGFDPEVGGDVTGIDRGYYPQARTFILGANIQF